VKLGKGRRSEEEREGRGEERKEWSGVEGKGGREFLTDRTASPFKNFGSATAEYRY